MVYGIDWKQKTWQKTNTTITKREKRKKGKKIVISNARGLENLGTYLISFRYIFFLLVSLILKRRPVAFFVDNFISVYHPPSISLSYRSLFVSVIFFSLSLFLSPFSSSLSPSPPPSSSSSSSHSSSSSSPIFGRTRSIKCPTKRE